MIWLNRGGPAMSPKSAGKLKMYKWRTVTAIPAILAFCLCLLIFAGNIHGKTKRVTFENGMEVIFKENHSSPMITSIVFVRAGAKYENAFNSGITHFLEHLLFDGTVNRSREEISRGIEDHGGYINAFTRKDFTAYLVLMPRDYIDIGLEIQADQLFNSIFPEEELAKERKVVIEEIQMNNDDPSVLANYFFEAKSLAGTGYARPVLGYKNIIASISRERIIEYWQQFYAPNNMTALVIGDFDSEEMIEKFGSVFGIVPPVGLASPPVIEYEPPVGKQVFKKAGNTQNSYLTVAIDAPHYTDPDYYAFDLLADYLGDREMSPLADLLADVDGQPLYRTFSVGLETREELSRLVFDFEIDQPEKAEIILAGLDTLFGGFAEYQPTAEILNGLIVSKKTNEIYLQERLHYYGFIIAPRLVITGWDFMESYLDAVASVNPSIMTRAVERRLPEVNYIATVYYPAVEKESVSDETVSPNIFRRKALDNGLTLVVKSNSDSRVFALNVIGKNRSALEGPGKTGITDFVNRVIPRGTKSRPGEVLSQELASIGANVTVGDMPWISHDDFYTTRQYSFMKFETIDEYTEKGLELFADMIKNPAFDSADVESVRGFLMGVLGRQSDSPLDVARDLFYATLFEGQAYAKNINGSPRTVGMISPADLAAHHSHIYAPNNMIITVGTNYDADSMMALLETAFGDMVPMVMPTPRIEPGPAIQGIKRAHTGMEKEQIYIYLGHMLPGIKDGDAVALKVAASILSDRLQSELREKKGLAYSVGAGTSFDRDFGWFSCVMGTGADNFSEAHVGIMMEIARLKDEGVTEEELETARNGIWGQSLMRRLSRINQAHYMGIYEYLGVGYDYLDKMLEAMGKLSTADIKRVANKYFDTENYVLATAGRYP